jgi:hypothetical protein
MRRRRRRRCSRRMMRSRGGGGGGGRGSRARLKFYMRGHSTLSERPILPANRPIIIPEGTW